MYTFSPPHILIQNPQKYPPLVSASKGYFFGFPNAANTHQAVFANIALVNVYLTNLSHSARNARHFSEHTEKCSRLSEQTLEAHEKRSRLSEKFIASNPMFIGVLPIEQGEFPQVISESTVHFSRKFSRTSQKSAVIGGRA